MDGPTYTTDDLIAIRTARLRGVRSVQFADRATTYTSDAEMAAVEAAIVRSLESATATPRRSRQSYAVGSKGL